MKIEVHTLMWGEGDMDLNALFLECYCSYADRVVIWEYGKGSPYEHKCPELYDQIAEYPNAELSTFVCTPHGAEDYRLFRNTCWRDSDADWFIVVDADEWIWHPEIRDYLAYTSAPVLRCWGYNITGDASAPFHVGLECWGGCFDNYYCKPSVFQGGQRYVNFYRGGHDIAAATPPWESELVLLHGKWLGSPESRQRRLNLLTQRSPSFPGRAVYGQHVYTFAFQMEKKLASLNRLAVPVPAILAVREWLSRGKDGEYLLAYLNGEIPLEKREWTEELVHQVVGTTLTVPPPQYISTSSEYDFWIKHGLQLAAVCGDTLGNEKQQALALATQLHEWELVLGLRERGYTPEHFPFMQEIEEPPEPWASAVAQVAHRNVTYPEVPASLFALDKQVRTKARVD